MHVHAHVHVFLLHVLDRTLHGTRTLHITYKSSTSTVFCRSTFLLSYMLSIVLCTCYTCRTYACIYMLDIHTTYRATCCFVHVLHVQFPHITTCIAFCRFLPYTFLPFCIPFLSIYIEVVELILQFCRCQFCRSSDFTFARSILQFTFYIVRFTSSFSFIEFYMSIIGYSSCQFLYIYITWLHYTLHYILVHIT